MNNDTIVLGVPKEVKIGERRVGLTPDSIWYLKSVKNNISFLVESDAGVGSGHSDEDYIMSGAEIVSREVLWERSRLIVKVKEPIESEYPLIKNKIIYGYFHLNSPSSGPLKDAIRKADAICIPYEDIVDGKHRPCLAPMSIIAGKLAAQKGAQYLESTHGKGLLMSGVQGVSSANVVVVGGGTSGLNAATVARGMGANVTILDINRDLLDNLSTYSGFNTMYANESSLNSIIPKADVLIGAVLSPGFCAPKVITEEMLSKMSKGSVVVDIAIDEGGCTEWSKPTTHSDPIFIKNDIIFYCVTNMPGLVPITATDALNAATVPYLEQIIKHLNINESNFYDVVFEFTNKNISIKHPGFL